MLIAVGDFLKGIYEIYSKNFVQFIKYILLIVLVTFGISIVGGLVVMASSLAFISLGVTGIIIGAVIIIAIIIALIYLTSWMGFTFIKVVNDVVLKQEPKKLAENFKLVRPLVWNGFGTSLLVGLYIIWPFFVALSGYAIVSFLALNLGVGVVIASLLRTVFILFGLYGFFHMVYFGTKYQYAIISVIVDNKKAKEAIKLSASLVQGRWWAIFGRMFLVGLVIMGITIVLSIIFGIFTGIFKSVVFSLLTSFIVQLVQIVLGYAIAIGSVVLFQNLKTLPAVEKK